MASRGKLIQSCNGTLLPSKVQLGSTRLWLLIRFKLAEDIHVARVQLMQLVHSDPYTSQVDRAAS